MLLKSLSAHNWKRIFVIENKNNIIESGIIHQTPVFFFPQSTL